MRHINLSALWIRNVQDREGAEYKKILGTEHLDELMTKHLARDKIDKSMPTVGQQFQPCRADRGLDMQEVGTA